MTRRSRAREVALQLLFQRDYNPNIDQAILERFVQERLRDPDLRSFCLSLYEGVLSHLAEIDQQLAKSAENWRLQRMAGVDRNVLRLGAYEILYAPPMPAAAAINEAIELARRYGSADSPGFVNAILDRIKSGVEKPAESPPST